MAKAIMIQGTMSGAGKSLITAALCRIFKQDGFSAAPFKSQNMALNSFITNDGLEIGRAQAMQAQAAEIEPSVFMNPILLKPATDIGSQVIVNGKVIGNMTAAEYFKYKKSLVPDILSAYNTLSQQHDIIVIEGAGSPAELNLKADDIVNMGLAKLVNSPVILVGDIDRGGIFAQLLGTLMLLENDEQNLIKGFIVNRFRGDKNIFKTGTDILESRGKKPVLGVIPYIRCDIEDEDSLSDKLSNVKPDLINIVVIKLPRISNFTDFDVFSQYDGVSVTFAESFNQLETADLIIIPGTKNTLSDMKWLRESGMETMILKLASKGVPVFGICGGYQMLGKKISDPLNTEGGGEINGIGLLSGDTVFEDEKIRKNTSGRFQNISGFFSCLSNTNFNGYEIHMGRTSHNGSALLDCGGEYRNNVAGCYIHGIFDDDEVSKKLVQKLFQIKKIPYNQGYVSRQQYKNSQFNLLANEVRNNINMKKIYEILGV